MAKEPHDCTEFPCPVCDHPDPNPESFDPAAAARASFEEPETRWSERRRGREGRSIPHSYGGEGRNHVD